MQGNVASRNKYAESSRRLVTQEGVRPMRATGEKKLMTDYAFQEEIMIKMNLLAEVQMEIGLSVFGDENTKQERVFSKDKYSFEQGESE